MYQKNWDEYFKLLRKKNLSDGELLSKIEEELDAVERWKQNKSTMTRIYPTSSNIKEMKYYFNIQLATQFKQRITDKITLTISQLQEIISFISRFRQITFDFQIKYKNKHGKMLERLYSENFNPDDSMHYINRTFESILMRILYIQGISHEIIANVLSTHKRGSWKFYLNFFSSILFQYGSYDEFIAKLRSIVNKLTLVTFNFNGLLIPFILSKLSDENSNAIENWVRNNHRGIIITENESTPVVTDKIILGIKAIELICSSLNNNAGKKIRILIVGQNSSILSRWHYEIVSKMGMPMYYNNFRKIRLSTYNRKKRILLEFIRIHKILNIIHSYPFDLEQIYGSFGCDLMIIDDIGALNEKKIKILKIPNQNLIGFCKDLENFGRIKKLTAMIGNIVYPSDQIVSATQKKVVYKTPILPKQDNNVKKGKRQIIKTLDFFLK